MLKRTLGALVMLICLGGMTFSASAQIDPVNIHDVGKSPPVSLKDKVELSYRYADFVAIGKFSQNTKLESLEIQEKPGFHPWQLNEFVFIPQQVLKGNWKVGEAQPVAIQIYADRDTNAKKFSREAYDAVSKKLDEYERLCESGKDAGIDSLVTIEAAFKQGAFVAPYTFLVDVTPVIPKDQKPPPSLGYRDPHYSAYRLADVPIESGATYAFFVRLRQPPFKWRSFMTTPPDIDLYLVAGETGKRVSGYLEALSGAQLK
jgi:hypothetical protein